MDVKQQVSTAICFGAEGVDPPGFTIPDFSAGWWTNWMHKLGWLTADQSVTEAVSKRIGLGYGYTTVIARFTFTFSGPVAENVPHQVVAKLPIEGFNPESPQAQFFGAVYQREVEFFNHFHSNPPPFRIPKVYYGVRMSNNHFVLIMEDLVLSGAEVGDQAKGISAEEAQVALQKLAAFHAYFWEKQEWFDKPWISNSKSLLHIFKGFFVLAWPYFCEYYTKQGGTVTPQIERVGKALCDFLPSADLSPSSPGKTIIHGDFRPDNMFFWRGDQKDPSDPSNIFCGLDFQILHVGNVAEDLAYFIVSCVSAELRRKHENEWLHAYCHALKSHGIEYPFEKCKSDYLEASLLGLSLPATSAWSKSQQPKNVEQGENEGLDQQEKLFATWFERGVGTLVENDLDVILERIVTRYAKGEDKHADMEQEMKGVAIFMDELGKSVTDLVMTPTIFRESGKMEAATKEGRERKEVVGGIKEEQIGNVQYTRYLPAEYKSDSLIILFLNSSFVRSPKALRDNSIRRLTNEFGCPVVLTEPRFAPESQHPVPVTDSSDAIKFLTSPDGQKWIDARAPADPSNVLVYGVGAGCHFAIQSLISSKTSVGGLALVCPQIDPHCNSESYIKTNERFKWYKNTIPCAMGWEAYLPTYSDASSWENDPSVCVLKASADSLKASIPRTVLYVAELDQNCTEGQQLGKLFEDAGVDVTLNVVPGVIAFAFSPEFKVGRETDAALQTWWSSK